MKRRVPHTETFSYKIEKIITVAERIISKLVLCFVLYVAGWPRVRKYNQEIKSSFNFENVEHK